MRIHSRGDAPSELKSTTERASAIALVWVPALLALTIHAIFLVTQPLNPDEAFNLLVSLNVALGNGYQTWYEAPTPFDPLVTTGPAVLAPAGAVLRVLPRTAIAGRLVMTAYFIAFLVIVYHVGKRLMPQRPRVFFAAALLFLFCIPSFDFQTALVLGEIPSIAFYLLTLLLITRTEGTRPTWIGAGMFFGVAALTKLNILLCVAIPVMTAAMVSYPRGPLTVIRALGYFALGVVLPVLAWQGYKLGVLGWSRYQSLWSATMAFIRTHGSGANSPFANIATRVPAHLDVLSTALGRGPILIAGALVIVLTCAAVLWLRHGRPPLGFAIIGSASALLVWWLAVSDWNWYRHAVPGYVFVALACAYIVTLAVSLVSRTSSTDRAILVVGIIAAVCCIPVGPGVAHMIGRLRTPSPALLTSQRQSEAGLASLVDQITRREPGATFWAYGLCEAPEISYLTATPFRDITVGKPTGGGPHYLIVGPHYGTPEVDAFADRTCADNVFHEGFYRLCHLNVLGTRAVPGRLRRMPMIPPRLPGVSSR